MVTLLLAPMAKVTNLPFRIMCREYGADIVFSEMMNANALARNNKATLKKAITCSGERPVAMQIFGTKEEVMLEAASKLDCDYLDINMGCPDRSVVSSGAGAALLKRPDKVFRLVKALSGKYNVSAKIRIDKDLTKTIKIVDAIREGGAKFVSVHARTAAQGYSGKADWNAVKIIKEHAKLPVYANGDIIDGRSAEECLNITKADGVMIGRAAMGNPFIFRQIKEHCNDQDPKEKINDFFRYIELCKKYGCLTVQDAKIHAHWFTRGIKGAKRIRPELTGVETVEEIIRIMKELQA